MKAEPAQSVRTSTTATLFFNVRIPCVLVLAHKSMLPAKEKAVVVFSNSTLAVATRRLDTLSCSSSGEQSWCSRESCSGRRQRWELVADLGLGACWSSPTFSQSVETSGHGGKSVSSVRELQLVYEPSHLGTGEPGLRISQVWWFEICRKISNNKGTPENKGTADLTSTLLLFFFT